MAATVNYYPVPSSSSSVQSPETVTLSRAQTLLGTTVNTVWGTHFFDQTGWAATITAGASANILNTGKSGVLLASTGAAASNQFIISPNWTSDTAGAVDNPQTSLWYAKVLAKITTAVDAQARIGVCELRNNGSNSSATLGVLGSVSTATFYGQVVNNAGTATNVNTSVAVDTGWHTWEIWNDLTNINFGIDGASVATTAVANIGTNALNFRILVQNGTTAANRAVQFDAMYVCTVSNV